MFYIYIQRFNEAEVLANAENDAENESLYTGPERQLTYIPGKYRICSDNRRFWLFSDGGTFIGIYDSEEEAKITAAVLGTECSDEIKNIDLADKRSVDYTSNILFY